MGSHQLDVMKMLGYTGFALSMLMVLAIVIM
jgi:hypothetical protein